MSAPLTVVVGATDLDATAAFLALLDFAEESRGVHDHTVAAARYGHESPTAWRRLTAGGTTRGAFRLVETAHAGAARAAIEMGPLAVDVYTRDMDASIARLDDAGVEHGHVGTLDLGALVMRQCEVIAPDGWRLVLVEANHRRPSILDDDPDRLHSEVHSVLWTVPSIADATPGLTAFGLTQAHVFPIRHPELARIISLPAPDTEMTMNLLVDDAESPIRVELCEFADHPGAPAGPGPLRGGIHAIAFGESTRATTQTFASGVRIER